MPKRFSSFWMDIGSLARRRPPCRRARAGAGALDVRRRRSCTDEGRVRRPVGARRASPRSCSSKSSSRKRVSVARRGRAAARAGRARGRGASRPRPGSGPRGRAPAPSSTTRSSFSGMRGFRVRGRGHAALAHHLQDAHLRGAQERLLVGEHLVEDDAQREDVASGGPSACPRPAPGSCRAACRAARPCR